MNGNSRPSTDDIRNLSNSSLIKRFIDDTSHRSLYELEIYKRIDQKKLNLLLLDTVPNYVLNDSRGENRSIRETWRMVRDGNLPIRALVEDLQSTGWDCSDPSRRVKMSPHEIREFLQAFLFYRDDEFYDDVPEGMRNLLGMTYDAYCRWQMRRDQMPHVVHGS